MCECPHVLAGRDSDTCPPFLPSPSDPTSPCDCPTCEEPDVTTPTQCANICDTEKCTNHTTTATVGTSGGENQGSAPPPTTRG